MKAFSQTAIKTIEIELQAIAALVETIDSEFELACQICLDCKGRIVVTGMGKSGHIAKKIAATLASTGSPAMYVHPAEASHGDIGMITEQDVVLALSNSGSTEEIISLLPVLKRKGIALISMTGNPQSALALAATANINAQVAEEACPLGLAPTSSTTAALVLGDALAMALLEARGFTRDDFAISHPGGNLGRRLLLKVKDIMHIDKEIPQVNRGTPLRQALPEMTEKGFGLTTVMDTQQQLCGIFTDGDLRRAIDSGQDIQNVLIEEVMSTQFQSIDGNSLAVEAAKKMQDANIYVLIVKNDKGDTQGIIKMHDLLKANVV